MMTSLQARPAQGLALLGSLMGHVSSVVGAPAARTLFRYGAIEEGKRIARERGAVDLRALLDEVDGLLGQATTIHPTPTKPIVLSVSGSAAYGDAENPLREVLLGLLEGILGESQRKRYRAEITARGVDANDITVEIKESEA